MYTKLAVPFDGSALAESALPDAVLLAERLDAHVLLMRVVPTAVIIESGDTECRRLTAAEVYLQSVRATISDSSLSHHLDPDRVETLALYGTPHTR